MEKKLAKIPYTKKKFVKYCKDCMWSCYCEPHYNQIAEDCFTPNDGSRGYQTLLLC